VKATKFWVIPTVQRLLPGNKIREDEMEWPSSMREETLQVHTNFSWGSWREGVTWLIEIRLSIFLKWTIKKQSVTSWTWFLWRQDQIAWTCKQGNKHFLGYIKYAPFFSSWAAVNFPRRSLLLEEKHFCLARNINLSRVAGVSVGIDLYFL
jgi:hypothetical protein